MPSFKIVEGPGAGSDIPLTAQEAVLGRDKMADIALIDSLVSRQHAKVVLEGQSAHLIDLNSRNGTYVNRLPIDRHQLMDGDEIKIGETIFVFQADDALGASKSEELQIAQSSGFNEQLTVELPDVQAAIKAQDLGNIFENLPKEQRDLAILYEVGRTINSTLKLDSILGHVLDVIFQTIPVKRGVIFLSDPDSGKLKSRVIRNPEGAENEKVQVSETILNYARERGLGIIASDIMADERFGSSKSLETQVSHSMLCVPMKSRDEIVGIIYVDSDQKDAFNQKHLLLLNAVGNQAAIAIVNARLVDQLRLENRSLRRQLNQSNLIVGGSEKMREIYDIVRRVANSDATVLLRGESGTGKEVIARAIHQQSSRRNKALICVNCAALSPTLLEAEIFGYERGAFTGATERRAGRFELANGGTLFLDEIGEMPIDLQAKLLRVLQEREFERVGGTESIKIDVRIITSTNRDLEKEMQEGSFREDLYYRLHVVPIMLPPLRERKEDIPKLIEEFIKLYSQEMGVQAPAVPQETMDALVAYDWPGNVRELKNLIERIMVLGCGEELLPELLPFSTQHTRVLSRPSEEVNEETDPEALSLSSAEEKHIRRVLDICEWNKSRSAELLKISRPRLDRKIKEYDLSP